MSDRNSEGSPLSRRDILKTAAAAGGLAISPTVAGARSSSKGTKVTERGSIDRRRSQRTQQVSLQVDGDGEYRFSVSGILAAKKAPKENVNSGTASGTFSDEVHSFSFSGEFVEFDVSENVNVTVNGDSFDADAFPEKSLSIVAPSGTEVDISASGAIEPVNADLDQPNPRRVTGTVKGRTSFKYSGELTYLEPLGDVKIFKQGQPVKSEDVLPSNFPGKIQISGGKAEATVYTSDATQIEQGPGAKAVDGAVTGSPTSRDVTARYNGNVEMIEHENGAVAEIWDTSKRVICKAPDDTSATFSVEATEGIALNREDMQQADITVEAGQSKAIKYRGRPSAASIDELDITFNTDAYKDAVKSAKLQLAAKFERTHAYTRIAEKTKSRVRHDEQGLRIASATGDMARDMVFFQLTDIPNGDYGAVHISRLRESNEVQSANYEIQWLAKNGSPQKISVSQLKNPMQGSSFEENTFERGKQGRTAARDGPTVDVFKGSSGGSFTTQGFTIPDWVPDIPSPQDLIDAFGDVLSDYASTIEDVTRETVSEIVSNAIENAQNATVDDIGFKTGIIIFDSKELLIEYIAEVQNKVPNGIMSKLLLDVRPAFAGSLVSLGQSGALKEIADNNLGCGGCLGAISILISVGLEATAHGTCVALGTTTFFVGGIACSIVVGALLEYANTISGPDVIDICSDDGTPVELDAC